MAFNHKLLIVFTVLVFASSCCYKEECVFETNREITFKLNEDMAMGGFDPNEASIVEYKIINPTSQAVEDSGFMMNQFRGQDTKASTYGFFESTDVGALGSLKNKNLILFLRGTNYADTVFNIDFTFFTDKKSCGSSCFFGGPSYTSVVTLTNRKGTYRGKQFNESDFPITITKN